jgi:hypothetical protein
MPAAATEERVPHRPERVNRHNAPARPARPRKRSPQGRSAAREAPSRRSVAQPRLIIRRRIRQRTGVRRPAGTRLEQAGPVVLADRGRPDLGEGVEDAYCVGLVGQAAYPGLT